MYAFPGRRTQTSALISGVLIAGLTLVFFRHAHLSEDYAESTAMDQVSAESEEIPSLGSVRESGMRSETVAQITLTAPLDQLPALSETELRTQRLDELPFPKNRAFTVRHMMFLSEERDPVWSPNTEAALLDRIARSSPDTGLTSVEVECRTTICRVQLSLIGKNYSGLFEDFSITATMHGYWFRKSIEDDLDLDVVLFDSGVVYGTPMSLIYLRRDRGSRMNDQKQ